MALPPPPRRRFPRREPGAAANRCRRPCGGSVVPAAGPGARRPRLASPRLARASLRRRRLPSAEPGRRRGPCAAAGTDVRRGGASTGREGRRRPGGPASSETRGDGDLGAQRSGAPGTCRPRGLTQPGSHRPRTSQSQNRIDPAPQSLGTSNTLGLKDFASHFPILHKLLMRPWELTDLQSHPAQRPREPHRPRAPSQLL
ncbi:translation initiation factor IF-2 [Mus musculus]|uniref:translation initiation factor IF-2 n=1 Tax=Mus musculus TaxID=10090 RepID=UPI001677BC62|nr:translation initiation factor IF-2 [Mus musculus]XP_036020528.1 translation initiation factor IF-2 [Mus musculus]XP_036020529.1 translation initiation factor IF-2 [Mus musculus]